MKYSKSLLAGLILLAMMGCNKEDDTNDLTAETQSPSEGTWTITHYEERGKIETADFDRYTFELLHDGAFLAYHQNGAEYKGLWNAYVDDGVSHLEISITEMDPLDELNDDWDIMIIEDDVIDLMDISSGDGHISKLTFSRL